MDGTFLPISLQKLLSNNIEHVPNTSLSSHNGTDGFPSGIFQEIVNHSVTTLLWYKLLFPLHKTVTISSHLALKSGRKQLWLYRSTGHQNPTWSNYIAEIPQYKIKPNQTEHVFRQSYNLAIIYNPGAINPRKIHVLSAKTSTTVAKKYRVFHQTHQNWQKANNLKFKKQIKEPQAQSWRCPK